MGMQENQGACTGSIETSSEGESSSLEEMLAGGTPVAEKIRFCVTLMHKLLLEDPVPFGDFWSVRRQCVQLFESPLHPAVRGTLWKELSVISNEGRQASQQVDESAREGLEATEAALAAIEEELDGIEAAEGQLPLFELPQFFADLAKRGREYDFLQRRLTLWSRHLLQLRALRGELLQMVVGVRLKSPLLKRLSERGDLLYAQRQEKMKELGELFRRDVELFIQKRFEGERPQVPFFQLRDEIKNLQALKKELILLLDDAKAMGERLSSCWEWVRAAERQWKKQKQEKQEADKTQLTPLLLSLQEVDEKIKEGSLAPSSLRKELTTLDRQAKGVLSERVGRQEWKAKLDLSWKALRDWEEEARAQEALKREEQARAEAAFLEEVRGLTLSLQQKEQGEEEIGAAYEALKERIPPSQQTPKIKKELAALSSHLHRSRLVQEAEKMEGGERSSLEKKLMQELEEAEEALDGVRREKSRSSHSFTTLFRLEEEQKGLEEHIEQLQTYLAQLATSS